MLLFGLPADRFQLAFFAFFASLAFFAFFALLAASKRALQGFHEVQHLRFFPVCVGVFGHNKVKQLRAESNGELLGSHNYV